jgi:hypothetical protein
MDLFSMLSSIVFDTPEFEPTTSTTPVDSIDNGGGGGGSGCIVA